MDMHYISPLQKHLFIHLSLYSKYNITTPIYSHLRITALIHHKSHKLSLLAKEQGIDDYFEDYLKRYYYSTESIVRIPQMAAFYKNYLIIFGVPTFREFRLNANMHSYATNKAEIYYNNHCQNDANKVSSLESNSNTKQPIESKPGNILTRTIIQSIENKTEQSSVSLIFNEKEINCDKFKKFSPLSKEESLLTLLLMIDPVTDVLKDKMKKLSTALTSKNSFNNKVSTVDKTKTVKEDLNDNGERDLPSNKKAPKKSRNKNLNSCGLLNTINPNTDMLITKTKPNKKYQSIAGHLGKFSTFFQQINFKQLKQLVKQIKSKAKPKQLLILPSKRNMPHNSPEKSRSTSQTNKNLTGTFKNSDFVHFPFQPTSMNEYNSLKVKSTNANPTKNVRPHHKSYFSLTTKNMPVYVPHANERQSTQENVRPSLTISDSEKSKPKCNKLNITTKASSYLRQSKSKLKEKELHLTKDKRLKSYSHIRDLSSKSKPCKTKESTHSIQILNTYFNHRSKQIKKIKLTTSQYQRPCYLMTQQDEKVTKPSVKLQMSQMQKKAAIHPSDKPKISQSNIALIKKKSTFDSCNNGKASATSKLNPKK